jgi:hypothetical protein
LRHQQDPAHHRSLHAGYDGLTAEELGVSPRDALMILGHAHISTTMQIYTHVDTEARDDALTGLDKLLGGDQGTQPSDDDDQGRQEGEQD